ncbi:hypothetical protein [Brevibacterium zhoupengii]|uniref:hypothetical protein n=1 Tax=Brevibacterium zhoupengii TaxID=2898795 RepID=UPI001E341CAF|nr:hypothetical protein [Brevibacterium zhoupengii]
MESQSYYQNEHNTQAQQPPPAPRALRWLVVGVIASIILLIALPIVMMVDQAGLRAAIEEDTGGNLDPEWKDWVLVASIVYAVVLHLIDVALLLWLVPKVLRGRNWARITLTVYLIVATYFSLYSATQGAMFLWAVIPTDILHVLMIGLLWIPSSVRRYFGPQRSMTHQL